MVGYFAGRVQHGGSIQFMNGANGQNGGADVWKSHGTGAAECDCRKANFSLYRSDG